MILNAGPETLQSRHLTDWSLAQASSTLCTEFHWNESTTFWVISLTSKNEWMMFLLTCDKKLTKSQLSPTHASRRTNQRKHSNLLWWRWIYLIMIIHGGLDTSVLVWCSGWWWCHWHGKYSGWHTEHAGVSNGLRMAQHQGSLSASWTVDLNCPSYWPQQGQWPR